MVDDTYDERCQCCRCDRQSEQPSDEVIGRSVETVFALRELDRDQRRDDDVGDRSREVMRLRGHGHQCEASACVRPQF